MMICAADIGNRQITIFCHVAVIFLLLGCVMFLAFVVCVCHANAIFVPYFGHFPKRRQILK